MKPIRGLTLIELVIVVAIIGILSAVVSPMVTMYVRSSQQIEESTQYQRSTQRVALYLRPLFESASSIQLAEAQECQFISDGVVYKVWPQSGSNGYDLMLSVDGVSYLLANGLASMGSVSELAFHYVDYYQSTTTVLSDISSIQLSFSFQGRNRLYPFSHTFIVKQGAIELN